MEGAPDLRDERPRLVYFYSRASGRARRVEGFLASVLQRRGNHETFDLHRVAVEDRPDLAERFSVNGEPTLVVIESRRVSGRLANPRGTQDIHAFLTPWLKASRRAADD
jgi:thioredoxin-like negative regulator of GroEL